MMGVRLPMLALLLFWGVALSTPVSQHPRPTQHSDVASTMISRDDNFISRSLNTIERSDGLSHEYNAHPEKNSTMGRRDQGRSSPSKPHSSNLDKRGDNNGGQRPAVEEIRRPNSNPPHGSHRSDGRHQSHTSEGRHPSQTSEGRHPTHASERRPGNHPPPGRPGDHPPPGRPGDNPPPSRHRTHTSEGRHGRPTGAPDNDQHRPGGCGSGKVSLDQKTWKEFKVDQFMQWYIDSEGPRNNFYGKGLLSHFMEKFDIKQNVCSVQQGCDIIPNCPNPQRTNATQIYLAYTAMANVAQFFHIIYDTIGNNAIQQAMAVDSIANDFFPPTVIPGAPPYSPNGLQIGSLVAGLASFLFLPFGGVGMAIGAIGGIAAGAMGAADLADSASGGSPDIIIKPDQNSAALSNQLSVLTTTLQNGVAQWYKNVLGHGKGFHDFFDGGILVKPSVIQFGTSKQEQAAGFLHQYVMIKLINYAMWSQNAYISYTPYKGSLTQQTCESSYKGKGGDYVYCNSKTYKMGSQQLPPGMARLTWYNSETRDQWGPCKWIASQSGQTMRQGRDHSANPPLPDGGKCQFLTTGGSYAFDPADVVEGSVKSYGKGGYDFDALTDQMTKDGMSPGKIMDTLATVQGLQPTSPGMFNLPLIWVENFDYWPDVDKHSGYGGFYDQQYDLMHHKPLLDHVPPALKDHLKHNPRTDDRVDNPDCGDLDKSQHWDYHDEFFTCQDCFWRPRFGPDGTSPAVPPPKPQGTSPPPAGPPKGSTGSCDACSHKVNNAGCNEDDDKCYQNKCKATDECKKCGADCSEFSWAAVAGHKKH